MEHQEAQESKNVVYKIVLRVNSAMDIEIYEYPVTKETAKSIMSGEQRFPREELDKPILDTYMGRLHRASLCMYETTKEEVCEEGIPALRKAVRNWLEEKAAYYNEYLQALEKQE